ncbi:hypothetical protein A2U01_0102834, partial [Trifolium medium]|nr:hypothetical protein [Trifolium medium]
VVMLFLKKMAVRLGCNDGGDVFDLLRDESG